jgi:hypothetical protein
VSKGTDEFVADLTVPADAFCLGETLEVVPTTTAELDRTVAYSPDHVMPFVWILGTDRVRFDSREYFLEFRDYVEAFGEMTRIRMSSPDIPETEHFGITPKQRGALLTAYDGATSAPRDRRRARRSHDS